MAPKLLLSWMCATFLAACASSPPPSSRPQQTTTQDDVVGQYVAALRDDLSHGKVQIITEVMHLDAAEAKVFWPIYHDYETELFELGDQRVDLIRRFATAQQSGALEDREASALADTYFRFESERLDLLRAYHGIVAQRLSPLRAAQFTQIEHRISTVIDLLIASELPLVYSRTTGR